MNVRTEVEEAMRALKTGAIRIADIHTKTEVTRLHKGDTLRIEERKSATVLVIERVGAKYLVTLKYITRVDRVQPF